MGLRPSEYDDLTPEDFADLAHGYVVRQLREDYRIATLMAWTGNLIRKPGGRKLTPEKMLGRAAMRMLRPRSSGAAIGDDEDDDA